METGKLSKGCPQNFFAYVNRNKRLNVRILQLRYPSGSLINSDQEMAELLKTTFLGFFREDEGSTPVLQPRTQTFMAEPLITKLEFRRVLDGLNPHKGAGPDGLFPKVLKALNSHIAPVLARMFNLSLQTAQVPEDWRHAIVTPVAKSPRTTNPRQFRPISLTYIVCKILEAILKEKLLSHSSQLSLLTTRQHGFLPRRSTLANLLSAEETVNRWLDEGDTVDIVCLDFAKAFDSVNHRLLLINLKCYGIAPSVINWIESYLRRRSFQGCVNGSLSQVAEAASGVPQGSVLGPILFVIYVNDLTDDLTIILNSSKSKHFPIGDTSNPVAYSLTSRTSPNA